MDFDVVLVGTDINAYYMARNFYEAYTIKPHVVGRVPMKFTSLSKILKLTIEEDLLNEDTFVNTLIDLSKKINKEKILLIGCTDDYVSLIIKNKQKLKDYFLFNYVDDDLLEKLVNKEKFYSSFKDFDLDLPKTYIYDLNTSLKELHKTINDFMYPLIIKPSNVVEYHAHSFEGMSKVYKLNNFEEVEKCLTDIKNSGYSDSVIIQEFIPGDDTLLFDSVFYCSSKGECQLQSFGQIGLQEHTKTGIGNLTVVINGYNEFNNTEIIQEKLKSFLEKIEFKGACEFDLKYDVRDNKFKVFEINPRQARSSYYLTKCGHNLATYFVDDLIYNKKKDFTFTQKQVLLSFVPKFVARKYITNKKYRKQVFKLWKKETFTDPLMCKKDLSFKRLVWLFLRKINYIKKYNKNNW